MKKQKEYKVYENAKVEELNSYMYAQIPGKGGAAKEVYDVVFNADGERITVSVSMVDVNVLKEGDQGKLVLADHEIESFGDILGTKRRSLMKCPICGTEMNKGYLVTGIGEVMWIGEDVKLPQTRMRYTNAKRIPENTVLIQPSVPGRTQCETKAFRCPNCEIDIIFEKDK